MKTEEELSTESPAFGVEAPGLWTAIAALDDDLAVWGLFNARRLRRMPRWFDDVTLEWRMFLDIATGPSSGTTEEGVHWLEVVVMVVVTRCRQRDEDDVCCC